MDDVTVNACKKLRHRQHRKCKSEYDSCTKGFLEVLSSKSRGKKYKSSAVAEMGDRGHNRHGPKRWGLGAAVPLWRRAGTPSNTMRPGRGLLPYKVASSSIQPFGHSRHELKTEGCAPFRGGGATTPSNTTSLGPRFTSVPSGILMHPAV